VPKFTSAEEPAPAAPPPAAAARKGTRMVWFEASTPVEAVLYERDRLDIGAAFDGPAIVEQLDATTVVPPGWRAAVDRRRNLILQKA
jgi:N-methylhydantoinase A